MKNCITIAIALHVVLCPALTLAQDFIVLKDSTANRVKITSSIHSAEISYRHRGEISNISSSEIIWAVQKRRSMLVSVKRIPGMPPVKGWLHYLNSSSIGILQFNKVPKKQWKVKFTDVPLREIQGVSIHPGNSVKAGILIGAAAGFFIGGILSASTYEPCPDSWFGCPSADELFLEGAIVGVISGALVGASISGLVSVQFKVNANQQQFEKVQAALAKVGYEWRIKKPRK